MSIEARVNPFRVGTEIRDPADFVGRKKILRDVAGKMLDLQSVSVHGERRTGKTSLLLYLAHPASVSATGLPSNHIPVYFNFQGFTKARLGDVWQAIANAIAAHIRQRVPDGQVQSERFLTTVSKFSKVPELFVTGLAQALAYLDAPGFKVHLLFDEFEQTAENPNLGDHFYDALRSLPLGTRNTSFVIATRTGLSALQPVYNKASSPFFNIFTTLTLPLFQEDEVTQLILDYFARSGVDSSLAERLCAQSPFLYEVTGYHPFFLQALCYRLYERLDQPDWPLGQAGQEALHGFERDADPHFEYYWSLSTEKERTLIENLTTGQSIDWDTLRSAAQRLQDRCLIVQADSGWRLFSSVFDRWVQEKIKRLEELESLYVAGRACFVEGRWEAAIGSLQRIVDSGETYKDTTALIEEASRQLRLQALYAEAEIQLQEVKWVEATQTLEEILRIDPTFKDSQARLDHARAQSELQSLYERMIRCFSEEDWSQAIHILGAIRGRDPKYRDIVVRLREAERQKKFAQLYEAAVGSHETGNWRVAIEKYREIIREAGGYRDTVERLAQIQRELARLVNRGEKYLRRRKWEEAAKEFERVHSVDPDFRGVKARLEEANSHLRPEELRRRGEASLRVGDWREAVEIFEELRKSDPTDESVAARLEEAKEQLELDRLYRKGVEYLRKGKWGRASGTFERVIGLNPDYRDAAAKLKVAQERLSQSSPLARFLTSPVLQGFANVAQVIAFIAAVVPVVVGLTIAVARLASSVGATPTPKSPTLCNGTFDDKFECWEHGGELEQSIKCDEGQCYAVLGSPDYKCEGGVPVGEAWTKQSFQVPQTISPTLSLRYRIFSFDLDLYDFFQVSINGNPVGQFGNAVWDTSDCDREPWDSGWQVLEFDLNSYKGQATEVLFRNVNREHAWWNTWVYITDVEIGSLGGIHRISSQTGP